MPVGEKDIQQIFTQLSAHDVEQFYAAFQLAMKRQQMEQLTREIEQARQRVVDNEAKMVSVALPLIALVSLVELQANGVEDIDLLDRMLERGEEWLDQTMQNLQRCKQLNMLDEGITLWCEHALEGAYDWIASMSEQESLENSLDQPDDEPAAVTLPSESNTTTEDQLLRKLMSDDDEERVASITTEQTPPPQSEQSEQPEQDETIETPEAAIEAEETEISEPEEAIESEETEITEPETSEESLEAEAAEIQKPEALEEVSETEETKLSEAEALISEEEVQQVEEADKQEYDFAIQQAPVQERLPDEPAAEALPAPVATTDETAEVSTEESESPQHTDEQVEAEQELQEPHNAIAEQLVVLPEEEIREPENTEELANTEEPEVTEELANTEEPEVTEELANTEKTEATEELANTEKTEAAEESVNTEKTPNIEEPETGEETVNVAEPAVTVTAANGEATAEEWPYIYPEILVVAEEPRLHAEAEQPVISNQPATVEAEAPPQRSDSTQSQQTAQMSATGSGQPQPIQPGHAQAPDNKPRSRWQCSLAKLLGR